MQPGWIGGRWRRLITDVCPEPARHRLPGADDPGHRLGGRAAALAARRAEVLATHYQEFNYWKSDPTQTAARAQLATQRSAVDEEMTALLHQLLGPDFTPLPPAMNGEWRNWTAARVPAIG